MLTSNFEQELKKCTLKHGWYNSQLGKKHTYTHKINYDVEYNLNAFKSSYIMVYK